MFEREEFLKVYFVLVSKPTLKPIKLKPFNFKTELIPSNGTQHSNNKDINPIL
jgi:hypothetical protein